jgi:hypothetical protein
MGKRSKIGDGERKVRLSQDISLDATSFGLKPIGRMTFSLHITVTSAGQNVSRPNCYHELGDWS